MLIVLKQFKIRIHRPIVHAAKLAKFTFELRTLGLLVLDTRFTLMLPYICQLSIMMLAISISVIECRVPPRQLKLILLQSQSTDTDYWLKHNWQRQHGPTTCITFRMRLRAHTGSLCDMAAPSKEWTMIALRRVQQIHPRLRLQKPFSQLTDIMACSKHSCWMMVWTVKSDIGSTPIIRDTIQVQTTWQGLGAADTTTQAPWVGTTSRSGNIPPMDTLFWIPR